MGRYAVFSWRAKYPRKTMSISRGFHDVKMAHAALLRRLMDGREGVVVRLVDPFEERMLMPAALFEPSRNKTCAECGRLFRDNTKNLSKKRCSQRCTSRCTSREHREQRRMRKAS